MPGGWIGVDLDGTLARYDGWQGIEHIGEPVPAMVERVKAWLDQGIEVRIMTARVYGFGPDVRDAMLAEDHIKRWCVEHIGRELPVTCVKDYGMIQLWDDRCVQVEANTGRVLGDAEAKTA